MRRLMQLLMMFGPMIFRQYRKYQQNKASQQPAQKSDKQSDRRQDGDGGEDDHK